MLSLVLLEPRTQKNVNFYITLFCTVQVSCFVNIFVGQSRTRLFLRAESDLSAVLSKKELELIKQIGEGAYDFNIFILILFISVPASFSFGCVFSGTYRGGSVAIKRSKINKSARNNEQIKKELTVMSCLRSSFVVSFIGAAVCFPFPSFSLLSLSLV
jgi:hypothetical protein